MLVIRDIFQAKPGQASKLAKLFHEVTAEESGRRRILTDFVSSHNTVIIEMQAEDMAALDKLLQGRTKYAARLKEAGYTEMFDSGRREILQIMEG